MKFNLRVERYKSHESIDLSISSFNIYSGNNGTGKSSIIDIILLLNYVNNCQRSRINVNRIRKEYNFESLAYINNSRNSNDSFNINCNKTEFRFTLPDNIESYLGEFEVESSGVFDNEFANTLLIPASRYFDFNQRISDDVDYRTGRGILSIISNIKNKADQEQFNTSMKKIFGIDSISTNLSSGNIVILLDGKELALTGYGIRTTIPILVACIFNTNCNIIIENPEIHLHPSAQISLMKEVYAISKKNNNRIFIETHSDHILMSPSLIVSEKNNDIYKSDFSIYHFNHECYSEIEFSKSASHLIELPKNFMEQNIITYQEIEKNDSI